MQRQFSLVHVRGISQGIACPNRVSPCTRTPLPRGPLLSITLAKKKGFGTSNKNPEDDEKKGRKGGKVRQRKVQQTPLPGQNSTNPMFQSVLDLETSMQKEKEDAEFNSRLASLRATTKAQVAEMAATIPAQSTAPVAAFDAPVNIPSIYDSPPSLSQTLSQGLKIGGSATDISDPKLRNAAIGPNQIGLAVGAIVLGAIFLLSSVDLGGTSKRYKGVQPAQAPPDAVESGLLRGRISMLEQQFSKSPGDAGALEELAVAYAKLFDFDKSRQLLDILVELKPTDAEAWRLLGETALLSGKPGQSVKAYDKAIELGNSDLQVITGLVDACIADGKQSKAVDFLKTTLSSMTRASGSEGSAASTSGSRPADPRRVARPFDDVSLQLLLAKTYNGWRGHDKEALATYDAVVAKHPDDFRGYLARGVYLRENGKRTEADKMFMQAKFYAPEARQAFVQRLATDNPVIDLPTDD